MKVINIKAVIGMNDAGVECVYLMGPDTNTDNLKLHGFISGAYKDAEGNFQFTPSWEEHFEPGKIEPADESLSGEEECYESEETLNKILELLK